MTQQRRTARIAEQIKREVSQMLQRDIKDDRVGMGMTSITEVDVSGDLRYARIYVSIYGSASDREQTMQGLNSATGFVRRELAKRLALRFVPEISFAEDKSIERGTQVLALINRLAKERSAKEPTDGV